MNTISLEKPSSPSVLVFFCNSCCGPGATGEELSLSHLGGTIARVHFTCARDVTTQQIQQAFADGADGVLICGCLVRRCVNSPDDQVVLRSLYRNQITIMNLGLATERLREVWVVQGTTDNLEELIADFVAQLAKIGPIHPGRRPPNVRREKNRMSESRA